VNYDGPDKLGLPELEREHVQDIYLVVYRWNGGAQVCSAWTTHEDADLDKRHREHELGRFHAMTHGIRPRGTSHDVVKVSLGRAKAPRLPGF
jgi:hypothetical protein